MIVEKDALEMASKADPVILALGFNVACESEGGDRGVGRPL
jgi:beta-glucosidase